MSLLQSEDWQFSKEGALADSQDFEAQSASIRSSFNQYHYFFYENTSDNNNDNNNNNNNNNNDNNNKF